MSIWIEIQARGDERRLFGLPSRLGSSKRTLLVNDEIREFLFGANRSERQRACSEALRSELDAYSEGDPVDVAADPFRAGVAFFSRLYPPEDSLWEIRPRFLASNLRLFGAFAACDTFIAMSWSPRAYLKGRRSLEWKDAIRLCKAEWRRLFPTYNPHAGSYVCDYFSEGAFLIGNTPRAADSCARRKARLLPCSPEEEIL